jgi:hypothetical protein
MHDMFLALVRASAATADLKTRRYVDCRITAYLVVRLGVYTGLLCGAS